MVEAPSYNTEDIIIHYYANTINTREKYIYQPLPAFGVKCTQLYIYHQSHKVIFLKTDREIVQKIKIKNG